MLPELLSPDAGVQLVFVVGFFAALIVAMFLGYNTRSQRMESLKRENEHIRNLVGMKEQKINGLLVRAREVEKMVPKKDLEKLRYGFVQIEEHNHD